jgi:DNA-directed RNA polymerase subunit E'/Rpb7
METIKSAIATVTNLIAPVQAEQPTQAQQQPTQAQQQPTQAQQQPTQAQAQPQKPMTIKKQYPQKFNKPKHLDIYSSMLITRSIPVNIINVGNNIKQTLEKIIALQIEGKCVVDGYIKPNSTKILTYSSGLVNGPDIIFEVTFECLVCSPVEGMHIKCVAKNITKAGIRAETNETPSPVIIFIARDHNYTMPYFSTIKENDNIKVSVIGQRFELNDKYISIIAKLIEPKEDKYKVFGGKKAKLVITE